VSVTDAGPEGVLVIDKPAGPSSHDVVAQVRRILGTRRVGHTGTLDPSATGVLVVCVGRATRLVEVLQAGVKTYAATAVLGVTTDSQDLDGAVLTRTSAAHLDERSVCEALMAFQGPIRQVPPMVSAVKVGGEALYRKARRGEEVERPARDVVVHDLVLEDFVPGEQARVSFLVTCSAGTYVRTIAHDLGAALGVGGALASLRRIANGPFSVDEAVTLEALADRVAREGTAAALLPALDAVSRVVPVRTVEDVDEARRLAHGGAPVLGDGLGAGTVALVHAGRLLGLYDVTLEAGVASGRARLVWSRPEDLA
jgi:tRNA pseudouridine55 synthase